MSELESVGRVESLRQHPSDGRLQTEPGKTITVSVQAVDEHDEGVNDLPVFFAVSDRALVSFTEAGTFAQDWSLVQTAPGQVDHIQAPGIA